VVVLREQLLEVMMVVRELQEQYQAVLQFLYMVVRVEMQRQEITTQAVLEKQEVAVAVAVQVGTVLVIMVMQDM